MLLFFRCYYYYRKAKTAWQGNGLRGGFQRPNRSTNQNSQW